MLKGILLLLQVCAFSYSFAVINIVANTTLSGGTFSDDIVVHPGATLTLTGNCVFNQHKSITIMDGAALKAINGSLSASGELKWVGIKVNATPISNPSSILGVEMANFEIRDADIAIEHQNFCSPPTNCHNRRMDISYSTFTDNDEHIIIFNAFNSINVVEQYTQSDIIIIDHCVFSNSTEMWPIHIMYTKNLKVKNSSFLTADGDFIYLHLRAIIDGYFFNNHFDNSKSKTKMAIHGYCIDVTILNNSFDLSDSKIGLDVGSHAGSQLNRVYIGGNDFFASALNLAATGIKSGHNSTFEQVRIAKNDFTNLGYGGYLEGMNTNNDIILNSFNGCDKGLFFFNNNSSVKITCNTFDNQTEDITIGLTGTLMDQMFGSDPNNVFSNFIFGSGNYNIVNNGTTSFIYGYNINKIAIPVIPLAVVYFSGPIIATGTGITLWGVTNDINCDAELGGGPGGGGGGSTVPSQQTTGIRDGIATNGIQITQYPNPTKSVLHYSLDDHTVKEVHVMSVTGQMIINHKVVELSGSISVGQLRPGIYYCSYLGERGVIARVKFVKE
ncbi:MAG: hypothetical protein COA58_04280 [Bacteroidetes bacterium]|nr:MAG: hypothetical protein COA58_04280 [Bacteroidota bacterium]